MTYSLRFSLEKDPLTALHTPTYLPPGKYELGRRFQESDYLTLTLPSDGLLRLGNLENRFVSRRHAAIVLLENGKLYVQDIGTEGQGSTWGTSVFDSSSGETIYERLKAHQFPTSEALLASFLQGMKFGNLSGVLSLEYDLLQQGAVPLEGSDFKIALAANSEYPSTLRVTKFDR